MSATVPPTVNGAAAAAAPAEPVANGVDAPAPAADAPADQIQAYARLEFAQDDGQIADFYVAQLDVIIGRRPPLELSHAALSPSLAPPTSATRSTSPGGDEEPSPLLLPTTRASLSLRKPDPSTDVRVDLDLGPIKAVSRQHARLYFDYTTAAWALDVLGRNGVVVDGRWRAKGEKAIMHHRSVALVCVPSLTRSQRQDPDRRTHLLLRLAQRRPAVGSDCATYPRSLAERVVIRRRD